MSDDDLIPAVELTQWREGQVLTANDVKMLQRYMKEVEDEQAEQVDMFAAGREQAMRELGGQQLVDMVAAGDEARFKLAWKNACIKTAEKQAELAKLNQ